jgi:hypothetical protein
MKKIIFLIIIASFSCNSNQQKISEVESNIGDTTFTQVDLSDARRELIESYDHPIKFDTTVIWNDTSYSLVFTHFAAMDSGLSIPAKYNFDLNSEFVSHNFKSTIILIKEADTILNIAIGKETFREYMTPELKLYGTLLYPNVVFHPGWIALHYSLVIPVTDVGKSVVLKIDSNGELAVSD